MFKPHNGRAMRQRGTRAAQFLGASTCRSVSWRSRSGARLRLGKRSDRPRRGGGRGGLSLPGTRRAVCAAAVARRSRADAHKLSRAHAPAFFYYCVPPPNPLCRITTRTHPPHRTPSPPSASDGVDTTAWWRVTGGACVSSRWTLLVFVSAAAAAAGR